MSDISIRKFGNKFEPNWKLISSDTGYTIENGYFRTKKDAIDCLKEIYSNDHVPFFELDSQGKLSGYSFKEFKKDFKIIKL